jgi:phosphoserine phosphatase
MPTVIFDFDSTLITCESLEEILGKKKLSATMMQKIKDITNQGMTGTITFLSSLQQRLEITSLYKQDFIDFGNEAIQLLTPGIK